MKSASENTPDAGFGKLRLGMYVRMPMSSMSLCISELSYAESAHTASGLKPKTAICRFILSECTVESGTFPGVVCTSVISPCLASQV